MEYVLKLIPVLLVFGGLVGVVPLLVLAERKICAWIQNRVGPNRVGLIGPDSPLEIFGIKPRRRILGGLLQPLADAVKLFSKEVTRPDPADRWLYIMAPLFAILAPILAFVVIPIGADVQIGETLLKLQVADLHIGLLWVLAAASLSAYGIAFGGWASNNKFALLGSVRSMAQMISYEIGLAIVLLAVVMSYSSVSLREMVYLQAGASALDGGLWAGGSNWIWNWGIFHQPLAFVLFVICAFAENNRLPFDLPECEAELVGGYHTEYGSMNFGLFMQGEYFAMLGMGAIMSTLFLGGWHYPGYAALAEAWPLGAALLGPLVLGAKTLSYVLFAMWVRWTLPRFRWDQLLRIGWKGIVPLALANLLLTAFLNLPARAPAEQIPPAVILMDHGSLSLSTETESRN